MSESRLDVELFQRGLCKSRERARQLIKNGNVCVNGKTCTKPAYLVDDQSNIEVTGDIHRYVGRGGLKLEKAVSYFTIDLSGCICLDIGASTGGFTDCMLQNHASKVYALDVGHSQLDDILINDDRVINLENTNIRESCIDDFSDRIDFIATDVSFISLRLVLPKIKELLSPEGKAVVLIKPQFEAGKANIGKSGLVKDPSVHRRILNDITDFAGTLGFVVCGLCVSPIKGGSGNSEYLMYLQLADAEKKKFDIDQLINEALRKE